MTRHELQTQVMDWLAGLEDIEFEAAVIVAICPEFGPELHYSHMGVTENCTGEQYNKCVVNILDNGYKHGFLKRKDA